MGWRLARLGGVGRAWAWAPLLVLSLLFLLACPTPRTPSDVAASTDLPTSPVVCTDHGPTALVHAGDGAEHYVTTQSFVSLECELASRVELGTLHPMHQIWAPQAYDFAHQLATWLSRVLELPAMSLKFAYFTHVREGETTTPCEATPNGPYATGGGRPLCGLIEGASTVRGLSPWLVSLLDYGHRLDVNGDPNWQKLDSATALEAGVAELGFSDFVDFAHAFDTRYVYNPEVDRYGEMLRFPLDAQPPGWFGSSGGGGSGAGFEIFCQDDDGSDPVTLVSGGGGGGAGMSSPEDGTPVQAGGGGGGGVQIGEEGLPRIGAGMGNHPYGWLDVHGDVDPEAFALAMEGAIREMKDCHAAPGRVVALRGGGGGGGGWETYLEWDLTQPGAQAVEREPHGMSSGYGFQFALGEGVRLTPNAGQDELPLAVCPFGETEIDWRECFELPSTGGSGIGASEVPPTDPSALETTQGQPTEATEVAEGATGPDFAAINSVLSCASLTATALCGVATYTDPTSGETRPYGAYTAYTSCNCPVTNLYRDAYLPDAPPWNRINQACTFGDGEDDGAPSAPPELTEEQIAANPDWCPEVAGCPRLPGCPTTPSEE